MSQVASDTWQADVKQGYTWRMSGHFHSVHKMVSSKDDDVIVVLSGQ